MESATHKPCVDPLTGETIWIPVEYESWDAFREKILVDFVAERFYLLSQFRENYNDWDLQMRMDKKRELERNEMSVGLNTNSAQYQRIFGTAYDHTKISLDHFINLITFFMEDYSKKNRADYEEIRSGADALLEDCGELRTKGDCYLDLTALYEQTKTA